MNTSIRSVPSSQQPTHSAHTVRGLRRTLLALAISATVVGGAALARVPASAQHAPAASSATHSTLAVTPYGFCPSTTLICL